METEDVKPAPFVMPSAFAQAAEFAREEGLELQGSGLQEETVKLDETDVKYLVEIPFDAAAILTKFDGFSLDEEQATKLGKLFLKPLQRLLPKTKNLDLAIAVSALVGIAGEKYLEYKIHCADTARDTGQGQDEFSKV